METEPGITPEVSDEAAIAKVPSTLKFLDEDEIAKIQSLQSSNTVELEGKKYSLELTSHQDGKRLTLMIKDENRLIDIVYITPLTGKFNSLRKQGDLILALLAKIPEPVKKLKTPNFPPARRWVRNNLSAPISFEDPRKRRSGSG